MTRTQAQPLTPPELAEAVSEKVEAFAKAGLKVTGGRLETGDASGPRLALEFETEGASTDRHAKIWRSLAPGEEPPSRPNWASHFGEKAGAALKRLPASKVTQNDQNEFSVFDEKGNLETVLAGGAELAAFFSAYGSAFATVANAKRAETKEGPKHEKED